MVASDKDGNASEREVVISRVIDGPRRLVFEAYTDVRHLAEWWGPDGFTTTTHSFEFRRGGVWEFTMHGPDGTDFPNHIEWLEIVPLERIETLHGKRAADPNAFRSTIRFTERGGATEVTMTTRFPTKAQRDLVVEKYGAIEGGRQTLGKLAAYVAKLDR
jgi:uncharacterized protein YndB with AHSA1/START domain